MPNLYIPPFSWTFDGVTYSLNSRNVNISTGARVGGFSIRNNAAGGYIDLNGYSPVSNLANLSVSIIGSDNLIIGYVALTQIYANNNPSYSLPNVNLYIDGVQVSTGTFNNSTFPVIINNGGPQIVLNTCNCSAEIDILQQQINNLNAQLAQAQNIKESLFAEVKNWLLGDGLTDVGTALAIGGFTVGALEFAQYKTKTDTAFQISQEVGGQLVNYAKKVDVDVVADGVRLATDKADDAVALGGKLSGALQLAGILTTALTAVGVVVIEIQLQRLRSDFEQTTQRLDVKDIEITGEINNIKNMQQQHFVSLDASLQTVIGQLTNGVQPRLDIISSQVERVDDKIIPIGLTLESVKNQTTEEALKTANCKALNTCALPELRDMNNNQNQKIDYNRQLLENLWNTLGQRIIDGVINAYQNSINGSFNIDYCNGSGSKNYSWSGYASQGVSNGLQKIGEALNDLFCLAGSVGGSIERVDNQILSDKLDEIRDELNFDVVGSANNYAINDNLEKLQISGGVTYSDLRTSITAILARLENSQLTSWDAGLRANVFIPESWPVKIPGDRPQLIAGMYDAAKVGARGASKWELVIPHPLPSIKDWSLEQLTGYFPDYQRGSYYARTVLKDGSSFFVNAKSHAEALNYLNFLMELVDPTFRPDIVHDGGNNPYRFSLGKRPKDIAEVLVTCRAMAFYQTGRKQGEKPTKRWYFEPIEP